MNIDEIILSLPPISLAQMDDVKLMNRVDSKYWFHISMLPIILNNIADQYLVLEIKGERQLPYSSIYYDTELNNMFADHQRGKLNRFKIRRRIYNITASSFLEVKFKSNRGRTIKQRREAEYHPNEIDGVDSHFIEQLTPYNPTALRSVLESQFNRIMLVSRDMSERCTIDLGLRFRSMLNDRCEVAMDNIVVLEVKRDGRSYSGVVEALHSCRIREAGFSKYCVGRSLVDDTLKRGRFNDKIRRLARLEQGCIKRA